jgi:hypothetical protein
MEGTY